MKNNKFISFFVLFAILFFAASYAREDQYSSIVYEISNVPLETTTITTLTGQSEGVSSAIAAAQHQFYYGTKAWQGSFAAGAFDNDTAFSFGLAKRFQKTLINGSVSVENGKTGYGAALNWQF